MITAEVFKNLFYKQEDDYCVLASYAVAAYPFTNQEVISYFIDYCRHFNISANSNDAESKYLEDFKLRYPSPNMNGYLVIYELHNQSEETSFANARDSLKLEYVENADKEINHLEEVLASGKDILVNGFINDAAPLDLFSSMHSITIGYDEIGLFVYDVNEGAVERNISSLRDVGKLGNAFIISRA